jgi:biotin carboxyl carrier protein
MADAPDLKTLVIDGTAYRTRYTRKFAHREAYAPRAAGQVVAHLPGVVVAVRVRRGQRVKRGEPLLVLEAMKMQNDVVAPCDGEAGAVRVAVGQMVSKGQLLIELV